MREFAGRTAVITGGASGIGFALANIAVERQMNVVLADIEPEALAHAVQQLEERQANVIGVVTDVRRRENIENLLQSAIDAFGKVHLLFNNAGVVQGGAPKPIWETPDADWQWVTGVNFKGVLQGVQVFTPHMISHGEEGHIVNTASIAAFMPGSGPYGISKHGVVILSEALAFDLEAAGSKIGASVVVPGWVNTRIAEAERNRPTEFGTQANPEGESMSGVSALLAGGKSPEDLASHVFESIEQNRFYIFPHPGWDYMLRERAEAMLARQGPYRFDLAAHVATRAEGADI